MTYTGNPEVLENIVNNTPGTYSVIIFLGGGQAGVIGAGFAHAVEEEGLTDNVNAYIGLSSGSAAVYGLATNSVKTLKDIYHKDNIEENIFDIKRVWNIFARDRLEQAVLKRGIDDSNLGERKSKFIVGVTDIKTGEGRFIDLATEPRPLKAVLASLSTPLADRCDPISLDGRECNDGGLAYPNPLHDVARTLNRPANGEIALDQAPTDILIVDPGTFDGFATQPEVLAYVLNALGIRNPTLENLKRRRGKYLQEIPYIKGEKTLTNWNGDTVRVAAFHPKSTSLGMFTMDCGLLIQGEEAAREAAHELFLQARQKSVLS